MLVVDRVELVLDQRMRCGNSIVITPSGAKQDRDTRDEVVQVGNLGEHVVADDQVRPLAGVHQLARGLTAEELHEGRTPRSSAALATLAAGSMPSAGMPRCTKYCSR